MIFMNFLEISWNFRNFMIFMNFLCFYIKSGKRTPPRARTPKSCPNHWNTKQIHRSRRGAIRPEIIKTTQNHFFAHFGEFPPRINKIGKFLYFSLNFTKRGSLGGPEPRSLFFLRNIKVSEPPEYRKIVRNGYFLEISWNFIKFPEISWFVRIFHDSGEISPLLVFWSVSSPPGELKNLNIPIGITRFSACGGQGTTRILQKMILASFCGFSRNSAENGEILVNSRKIMVFVVFLGFWGSKPLRPWFWARNTKVSWRVAESRKSMDFMKFHDFHDFFTFSLKFLVFNEFHRICKKPTV